MKTEANRGEAPGTDSVPSASGGPADASGEELTALGSTASFSFQKQFPPPILLPPGPWPEVQQERGGWEHRSQAGRSHRESQQVGAAWCRGAGSGLLALATARVSEPEQPQVSRDSVGRGTFTLFCEVEMTVGLKGLL